MGACATKPKAEAGDAPAPEPEKEIVSGKEEVVVEEELKKVDGEKDKEIVDDDKRRSLGNLFEKEGKDTTEEDKTPSDPVKQEELSVNQNPTEGSDETNPCESGKTETPVEQTPKEVIETVDVAPTTEVSIEEAIVPPVNIETQVAPTTVVSIEEAIVPPVNIETQEPEEKQIVEDKPAATESQKSETPEENEAVEEKTTTVAQKPETAVEEKTTGGN
ncbi:hypothetical protein RHGRI_029766 [Rhododendron griersonianum]|uniref:Uncharacterized protein n=1 Tax=Rhododendron griersonianum TaxID=479676 RepID=A0AAV6IP22_9ERIC|nr:hypothetical protein RHGRI_029766 [Rhododendron griersonianum]